MRAIIEIIKDFWTALEVTAFLAEERIVEQAREKYETGVKV